jgi:sugar lactone lactonase YvrE
MFGGAGTAPGQFNEEVGLALDPQGNLWVADTWNNRIQELSPQGEPLAQFAVPSGWQSQSITNKPYLAVDGQGHVIATFPEQNQLIVFSADGQQLKQVPLPGNGSPVGATVAPDGRIFVADARGNVIDALPPQ